MAIDDAARARQRSLEIANKFPPETMTRSPLVKPIRVGEYVIGPPYLISLNGNSPQAAYKPVPNALDAAGDLEIIEAARVAEAALSGTYRPQNP